MDILSLHYDVLVPLLEYLDHPSLHQLGMTSRLAQELVVPLLLREVHLSGASTQMKSFMRFVRRGGNMKGRAALIRLLRLSLTNVVEFDEEQKQAIILLEGHRCIRILKELLPHCIQLHTISISAAMGIFMSGRKFSLRTVLQKLPKLARCIVEPDDDIACTCQPQSACLRCESRPAWAEAIKNMHGLRTIEFSAPCVISDSTLTQTLKGHASTLESLLLEGNLQDKDFLGAQWPNVRKLAFGSVVHREVLVQSFPNVKYLRLDGPFDATALSAEKRVIIMQNAVSERCWPHLDHVRGSTFGIRCMALKCHVRRLDIDLLDLPETLCILPLSDFERLLQTLQPEVLSLRVGSWSLAVYCRSVVVALPDLKVLNLNISQEPGTQFTLTLKNLQVLYVRNLLLGLQSLAYLCVNIHMPAPPVEENESGHAAVAMVNALRSTQYIELSWENAGWLRSWWYHSQIGPSSALGTVHVIRGISSALGLEARRRFMDGRV